MKKKLVAVGIISALTVTACVSAVKNNDRSVAAAGYETNFLDQSPARIFGTNDIAKLASSSKLDLKEARLITDNDAAFDSKLEMIKRAKKEIRMVYFIYSDDDSSALISQALIDKAKAGVQVKLLVDFITNSGKMDHLQMMVNEGKGNLHVHLYNFPSPRIISDAKYMTLPCPTDAPTSYDSCAQFKKPLMEALKGQEVTPFSKMFLGGLYGRSSTALKIAMGYGAGIDPAKYKALKDETDQQEQAVIFDFFKLAKEALGGSLMAKIKIQAALASNGATLNPVLNEIFGRLPVSNKDASADGISHGTELDHLTDYTHHKLVAIDGSEFQLGGRNIEDSYHMKSRLGTKGKYIFMDTDFYGHTSDGGTAEIEKSFDKMFDFKDMVADISDAQRLIGYDMSENPEALMMATGSCVQQAKAGKVQTAHLGSCIETALPSMPKFQSQEARAATAKQEMTNSFKRYTTKYKKQYRDNFRNMPFAKGVDSLSTGDVANAEVYYLENISYDRNATGDLRRRAGSRVGAEAKFNKNIHAAWYRDLENACVVSRNEKRDMRVVFHTAYLLMPSGLMHKISKMMNGDYGDCSRVKITLLTNSMETTDLNVINVVARYQLAALFKHYAGLVNYEKQFNEQNASIGRKYGRQFPSLEYYEYNASSVGSGVSLHTKTTVIGDDIIVGSANADVRSYYMDTNNAVLIRNAKDLTRDYLTFVDGITADAKRTSNRGDHYAQISDYDMKAENKFILAHMLQRWDKKGRVTPERQTQILAEIDTIGARITNDTNRLLRFRGDFEMMEAIEPGQRTKFEQEMNEMVNNFDNTFETL